MFGEEIVVCFFFHTRKPDAVVGPKPLLNFTPF
jgi:hypothetical protein